MHGNTQNTTTHTHSQNQTVEPQPYFVHHEFGGSTKLTTTLVHAISDVSGVDVTQAESHLSNYVDPTALDRLFKPGSSTTQHANGMLSFTMWNYQITIYHNGRIAIAPPAQPQPTPA